MKKLISLLIVFCFVLNSLGQTKQSDTSISLKVPAQVGLETSQVRNLENILSNAFTHSGYVSAGNNSAFVLMPQFIIEKERSLHNKEQAVIVLDTKLLLSISNVETGYIFLSISKKARGTGLDKKMAINDALSELSIGPEELKEFVQTGNERIVGYYENKWEEISAKAESLVRMANYEQAIAMLVSIPEKVSYYTQSLKKAEEVYLAYQNYQCAAVLNQAKLSYAQHQYREALDILLQAEAFNGQCAHEANALVSNIEYKISEEERRAWEQQKQEAEKQENLEIQRLKVIQQITSDYFEKIGSTISCNNL